jgi:hypothetical protein
MEDLGMNDINSFHSSVTLTLLRRTGALALAAVALSGCYMLKKVRGHDYSTEQDRLQKANQLAATCQLEEADKVLADIEDSTAKEDAQPLRENIANARKAMSKLPAKQPARAHAQWAELLNKDRPDTESVVRICMRKELDEALANKEDQTSLVVATIDDVWWSSREIRHQLTFGDDLPVERDHLAPTTVIENASKALEDVDVDFDPGVGLTMPALRNAIDAMVPLANRYVELDGLRMELDAQYKKGLVTTREYGTEKRELDQELSTYAKQLATASAWAEAYVRKQPPMPQVAIADDVAEDATDAEHDGDTKVSRGKSTKATKRGSKTTQRGKPKHSSKERHRRTSRGRKR